MATPYDFMTRESGGNTYATGATRQANPYATPQTGPNAQQGMIRQPTQANQTTNPQTGSNNNQTFSLYGNQQGQGGNTGGTYAGGENQSTRPTATTRPGIPGMSFTRDANGNPVYANGQTGDWATWNASRPWGQQYGAYTTPGTYRPPQAQQQAQPQPNGGNVGGTYQQPQQSNPYGVDTSMGGGAQRRTHNSKAPAPNRRHAPQQWASSNRSTASHNTPAGRPAPTPIPMVPLGWTISTQTDRPISIISMGRTAAGAAAEGQQARTQAAIPTGRTPTQS
jgi:hypothetical protein